ncbi:BadF/BadG/BcrA/BcrD ATPase family protein [Paenibacillus humicola]|uniref:BadF/BadG/BcrA/BcrD ATPase family protein n=1 Tax=Paenibacillus humicola TaxID=3110540 RepID=UPI00237B9530|nr:BadF/BadG/BcrA/BcrD ATPase family protein [Paenibacillus humicola]
MQYVLGLDGGGTKTELIAADPDGNELLLLQGGASNPKAVAFEEAMRHVTGLLDQVPLDPRDCRGVVMGLAGIYTEAERSRAMSHVADHYAKRCGLRMPVYLTNDAEIALTAGLGVNEGLVAIAGTGSAVFGFTPSGTHYRAGGWGHILGDTGSGYDIGLHTLQAVMLSFDGVCPPTAITRLVLDHSGIGSPADLRSIVYEPHIGKQHIADYARFAIEAAMHGDPAAAELIRKAAAGLAELACAVCGRDEWFAGTRIAVTGSIFAHSELYCDAFCERLHERLPRLAVVKSQRKSAYGAALLALRKFV